MRPELNIILNELFAYQRESKRYRATPQQIERNRSEIAAQRKIDERAREKANRDTTTQMLSNLTEEARKLPVDERIELVEEIWDSIAEENGGFELTEAQKQELDRRIQSAKQNPEAGRSWEDI